ncbi:hypothetical protein NA56DRAFT_648420 [Hyaloscypha hepaticicola]|uniref:Uncharacterized protein n=1 Tax=Hyaloscypha hepaticicola TaxID=2082293 RepID=A0A2J6PUH5_9HELO|nr:hypothetical protein NA56DRAFT_648420 [Hyaloscypha hepaticicola]
MSCVGGMILPPPAEPFPPARLGRHTSNRVVCRCTFLDGGTRSSSIYVESYSLLLFFSGCLVLIWSAVDTSVFANESQFFLYHSIRNHDEYKILGS